MNESSRIRTLIAVYLIAAIDNIGYAMVFVLFPPLLLHPEYGFISSHPSLAQKIIAMGVLYAAFPIAQFIGAPILGELADHYGRKSIFIVSIIGTMLGYFFTGLAIPLKSILLLFVTRFITGFFSANAGLCNATIADVSPNQKQRARNYGFLTVVWGVSFPIALILGGFFSNPNLSPLFGPTLPFYIVTAISIISLFIAYFYYVESLEKHDNKFRFTPFQAFINLYEAMTLRSTRKYFLLMILWTLAWGFTITWYGAYALQAFNVSQSIETTGLIIQGIFWTIGGSLLNPFLLRFLNIKPVAYIAFSVAAILIAIASCMPTFFSFLAFYAPSAAFGAIGLSSTFNLISLNAPQRQQGKAMGLAQSMNSLAFFLVPILGAITGAVTIYSFYPVAAFFMILGLLLLLFGNEPSLEKE